MTGPDDFHIRSHAPILSRPWIDVMFPSYFRPRLELTQKCTLYSFLDTAEARLLCTLNLDAFLSRSRAIPTSFSDNMTLAIARSLQGGFFHNAGDIVDKPLTHMVT